MTVEILIVDDVEFDDDDLSDVLEAISVQGNAATQGVLPSAPGVNALAVSGTASPLSVDSGWAMVKGFLVKNTAATTIAIPTPVTSTRIDTVALRVNLSASPKTAEIVRRAGVEGGTAPTLTQTTSTWEIALADASITTGGAITVTDRRGYMGDSSRTMYVMPNGGYNTTDAAVIAYGSPFILPDLKVCQIWGTFRVPAEWKLSDPITIYPIFQCATGNAYVSGEMDYGKIGGDWDGHVVGGISSFATKACTTGQIIKGTGMVLATPEAGDFVQVGFGRNGADANDTCGADMQFIGWVVEYTGRA